jgi:hypothetical protein
MKRVLLVLSFYCSTGSLFGQNWTGAVDSDWNNTSNWSAAPSNGDDIVIDPANYTGAMAQPVISLNSNFTPAEMLVQNGAQLTISATLNATDRVEIIGNGTQVILTGSGAFSLTGGGNNARLIFVDDAHLEMNGGSLTCGQRLLFELGATGTIHAGTVTVGETIALVDGSALGSSKLVQNGGTITTNAEFGFENEAGVFYPSFEQNGGILNINGSLLWLGAAPGAGKGYFRSFGGMVKVTGTIGNDPTSTMGMYLELNGPSAVLENSGTSVQLLAGDSLVLADSANWKDINTANWINDGVVFGTNTSFFQSGNTMLNGNPNGLGNAVYQLGNVTVPSGKSLVHIFPVELHISGNMDILGSFNHNNNQLILNGTKNQTINHTSNNLALHGLQVQNQANGPSDGGYGISLNTNININNNLQLNDGIIVCAPGKLVNLGDNLTLNGQSDSTFIEGYVQKNGDDAFIFPLGMVPDRYRPLTITAPASVNSLVKVGYKNTPYSSLTPVEAPMQSVSAFEYWDFTNSNPNDLLAVTVGWNNASQSGLTDCADISLTVWDGTKWAFTASGTSGLCNGAAEGELFSFGNLPANGPITIGFTSNVTQQTAVLCHGDSITVGTNTYSANGTYFDVFQDANGDDSTVVTVVTVLNPIINSISDNITSITVDAPTATSLAWINCLDGTPAAGSGSFTFTPVANGTYAVIASHNGCADTSDCVVIDQLGLSEFSMNKLEIYPNPLKTGEKLTVNTTADSFIIQTMEGKNMLPESVTSANGKSEIQLPALSSGIYLLKAISGTATPLTGRFIVD